MSDHRKCAGLFHCNGMILLADAQDILASVRNTDVQRVFLVPDARVEHLRDKHPFLETTIFNIIFLG